MKTNNKKKIVVSVLALAMGAGLAGSISGSVAWYQYSTKTSAAIAGTSAGTSRNLQISADNGANWSQHIDFGPTDFKPASIYEDSDGIHFVEHPVYKTELLPAAVGTTGYKADYSFVFKCDDTALNNSSAVSTSQVSKEVYLTYLGIENKSTGTNAKDITPAVRIAIDGEKDFLVSAAGGTTTTHGHLNLNGNLTNQTSQPIWDKDGYDANDVEGAEIDYKNYGTTTEQLPKRGLSYETVTPADVIADASNPYSFGDKTNRRLTTTLTEGNSAVVKITVWIEGWQPLDGGTTWDSDWIKQNFEIQMQFGCEADR